MTIERFMEFIRAQPFRPFTIHTADGRSFYVKHPEFVARSPKGRTVVVHYDEDRMVILDLLLVASVQLGRRLKRRPDSKRRRRTG